MTENIANNYSPLRTNSSSSPWRGPNPSPIPAIVGVGIVVVLVLSIILCTLVHRKRNRASTRDIEAGKSTPKDTISLQDLESVIPAQQYTNSKKYKKQEASTPGPFDSEVCAICLDILENEDEVRRLQCGHVFHQSCLDSWFKRQHYDCPMCKSVYIVGKENNMQVT